MTEGMTMMINPYLTRNHVTFEKLRPGPDDTPFGVWHRAFDIIHFDPDQPSPEDYRVMVSVSVTEDVTPDELRTHLLGMLAAVQGWANGHPVLAKPGPFGGEL